MRKPSLLETMAQIGVLTDKSNAIPCPFHGEEGKSFHYYPESDSFKCDLCDASGGAVQFWQYFFGVTFNEALRHFGETDNPSIIRDGRRRTAVHSQVPVTLNPEQVQRIADDIGDRLKAVKDKAITVAEGLKTSSVTDGEAILNERGRGTMDVLPKIEALLTLYNALISTKGREGVVRERGLFERHITEWSYLIDE